MKKRKIIKYSFIAIIIIGIIIGVIVFIFNQNQKDIPVYSIYELAMDNYWENSSESEGMVTEDKMQSVYLSSTQQVEKIAVKEGQKVKKGDVLLKYNTTLSNIEIERKNLEIQKLELDLSKAQKELEKIKAYQPGVPIWGSLPAQTPTVTEPTITKSLITLPEPEPKVEKEISPKPLTGNGTIEKPYLFVWSENKEYDNDFIQALMERAGEGKTEVVALFMIREGDSINGDLKKATKLKFTKKETGYSFSILEVYSGEEDPLYIIQTVEVEEEPLPEVGPIYSSTEIQKMILDKEKEISEINLNIKVARNEYKSLKKELDNTTVYSKFDGVVKTVLSMDDEIDNKPIIVVSGGGGYKIQGAINEFELNSISVGQEVNVQSYETGTFTVGTIEKISEYPTTQRGYYGSGNSNSSFYPYTVKVNEDENLREGEYVSLRINNEGQTSNNSFYLVGAFIVSEKNGKYYVYTVDENNKLEKREVSVGKNMQGMLEIKNGITRDDKLAFPYGKGLKEGANTREASIDELYMGY